MTRQRTFRKHGWSEWYRRTSSSNRGRQHWRSGWLSMGDRWGQQWRRAVATPWIAAEVLSVCMHALGAMKLLAFGYRDKNVHEKDWRCHAHSSEIALSGSRRLRSTLATAPVL